MADSETPIESVLVMVQNGMSDMDIIKRLTESGYSPVQITDALNQAKIKKEISGTEGLQPSIMQQIPVPSPRQAPVPSPTMDMSMQAPSQVNISAEYPAYPYQYPTQSQEQPKMDTEVIEEIAEEIVNEKWGEIKGKISDVIEWKIYAEKRISSVDDRIKRMEASMDRLQGALLSKVHWRGNGRH
jgi:DNA-binding transcriptional MerR regulator